MIQYSFQEMVSLLIQEFEVADKYTRETIAQQIKRSVKKNPVEGENSYYALAKANDGKYTHAQYLEIKRICEPYLCKRSSNPQIKAGNYYDNIRTKRKQLEDERKRNVLIKALDTAYRLYLPSDDIDACYEQLPFETIFEDFIEKNHRDPHDTTEFLDYVDYYMEKMRYAFVEVFDGEWRLMVDVSKAPVHLSSSKKKLLDSDYHYEPVWEVDETIDNGRNGEYVITDMHKRSYSIAKKKWAQKRFEMMIEAIYSALYEPIDDDKLLEHIFITLANYEPHQKLDIFAEAIEQLKDYRNYCKRKLSTAEESLGVEFFKTMEKDIISELKNYMDENWG